MPTHRTIDIAVIGAGAAGLTTAYSLRALGLEPLRDFLLVDAQPTPGATWQHARASLTVGRALQFGELVDAAGQADLGLSFSELSPNVPVRMAVTAAWRRYEDAYDLFVAHGIRVTSVVSTPRTAALSLATVSQTGQTGAFAARILINATGTWSNPFIPWYPGASVFRGEQVHAYRVEQFAPFAGLRVLVVGGGRSAVATLLELERVGAKSLWSTRRAPDFHCLPALSIRPRRPLTVGELDGVSLPRVRRMLRRGKPMPSDVAVRGIPLTREIFEARRRGVLRSRGPLLRLDPDGVRFADGSWESVDAVIWATGGRESVRHLAPLQLRGAGGTPKMADGWSRRDDRVAFVGYGPGLDPAQVLDDALTIGEDAITRLAQ